MARYRIGLLGAHKDIDYPRLLRLGIKNTLEEAGHTLVTMADLIPYRIHTNSDAYMRVACEIAARLDLDAVIYPAGSVAANLHGDTNKSVDLLLRTMNPAKTLVLEREVEGYRCLLKDNLPGMRACMRHLIETCGFTRIAFISGPERSRGAQEREGVYFEEMRAHGIEPKESWFARGNFSGDCADVAEQILDNNPDLEAIACAADLIAYTVYDVLNKRKLTVGKDVAVTGFDDHPRSAHLDPPLSTVHMTSYDYGCMAAQEAIRLCEGKPQQNASISSSFRARNSCGEGEHSRVEVVRALLHEQPFPSERLLSYAIDTTLVMASSSIVGDFASRLKAFLLKVQDAYLYHRAHLDEETLLFSSQDLSELFARTYRDHLSLEGFHMAAISALEALIEDVPDDGPWVVEQISYLHLRIARLLSSSEEENRLAVNKREWVSFHTVDDAMRMDRDPQLAYAFILEELDKLGIREADLYLLPEPVEFVGAHDFALSDRLLPLGSLSRGVTKVFTDAEPLVFQDLLDYALPRQEEEAVCTVGGIMAGNELIGVAVLDCGSASVHRQLMALLNLGAALKHLQMIATERELNEVLGRNNLILAEQSQHDEMTGLLNRRGFMRHARQMLSQSNGAEAAIIYFDLDGLKYINDTFGHDVGDVAIQAAARLVESCMPAGGLAARLGGDEFVALLLTEMPDEADQLVAYIQSAAAAYNDGHDQPFDLSISAGGSMFSVEGDAQTLLAGEMAKADERLYEMKRHHKQSRRGR